MSARLIPASLMLSLIVLSPPARAQEEIRKPAGATLFDPAEVEIKKPDNLSDQELKILRSLDTLSVDRLTQLMGVYERLGNDAVLEAIVNAILRRDPGNAEAKRVKESDALTETTRPAGYLEDIARKVMAGDVVSDPDSVPVQAATLIVGNRAPEAVALLEKLRSNQFKSGPFPYLDDLAYTLSEAGRLDESEAAYKAVLSDPKMPLESQQEARVSLPQVLLKKRMVAIRKSAGTNMNALVADSAKLLAEQPNDADVVAFRIETLMTAQRFDEAIAMLQKMRSAHDEANGPWPWLPTLGYCYIGARQHDKAVAIFREVQTNPAFDQVAHIEAESMILEIQVGRQIETGMSAMNRGDIKTGAAVLKKLETNFGTHRDVVGYRAIYLAKIGQGDEAIRQLEARRKIEEGKQIAFTQQDALADVYLELKQFEKARAATFVVINDPRYDPEMKLQALKRMEDIFVAEQQHLAYIELQNGNRSKARAIAADLNSKAPGRIEARMLNAEIALAYFDGKTARDELQAIKASPAFAGLPFSSQNALGAALAQTGDWAGASQAYAEVVDSPPFAYEPEDRFEAIWEQRFLSSWFRPTASFGIKGMIEDEGNAQQAEVSYTTQWIGDWRFRAFARVTYTSLKSGGLLGSRSDIHMEGGIAAMRRFRDNYYVEAMIGASEDDPIYSVHVGRLSYRSLAWSVGFVGNALSDDSVNLQALNGRENRAEFHIAGPLTDRINIELEGYYQWTRVGGSRLGEGYGASGSIDYVLQTETRKRPEISIGYFFDFSRFSHVGNLPPRLRSEVRRAEVAAPEVRKALARNDEVRRALASDFGSEVFDSLVDPYTNRHGVMLKARKHFENGLALSGQLGAFYSFDERSAEWTAAAALEYWINDRTMLYAEIRYESAGKGASSANGIWEASVGGQMTF